MPSRVPPLSIRAVLAGCGLGAKEASLACVIVMPRDLERITLLNFEKLGTLHNCMSSPPVRHEAEPNVDQHPIAFRIFQIYSAHLLNFTHNLVRFYIVKT